MLLHEALAGAPAFGDDDEADYPCLVRPAPPLHGVRPRALGAAIGAALAPDPAERPSLASFLEVLDEVAGWPAGHGRWLSANGGGGRALSPNAPS